MCYKVSTPTKDQLEGYFQKEDIRQGDVFTIDNFQPYFHADGFVNPHLPITTTEEPTRVQIGVWKLIPHWIKTVVEAKKYANTLNATCEDIFEKASYKSYINTNRSLLWVNGFFEPHHPDPKTTVPYYIRLKNGDPFSLGCVFSNWLNHDTGEIMKTFSIITTPANELMSQIHNDKKRMPLIIMPSKRKQWLGTLDKEQIQEMMQPLQDGLLEGYPVSNLVYKKGVNANVPEVQMPV